VEPISCYNSSKTKNIAKEGQMRTLGCLSYRVSEGT